MFPTVLIKLSPFFCSLNILIYSPPPPQPHQKQMLYCTTNIDCLVGGAEIFVPVHLCLKHNANVHQYSYYFSVVEVNDFDYWSSTEKLRNVNVSECL
jgi:hypothetical protein